MGSVKDLTVIEEPAEENTGRGRFLFSDRYSVFDWGEMPDKIPHKGEALTIMTTHFFRKLEERGIKTHYRGVVKYGKKRDFDSLKVPFDEIEVELVRVFEPRRIETGYDYSIYKDLKKNYLIPLEIIYRNSIPEGSSFWKRYESGEIDYNAGEELKPDKELKEPIFDFSTKLEETDRYISKEEAMEIARISDERFNKIKEILRTVNRLITEETAKCGLENQDGKIELAVDGDGNLMVVDALGTLDECRFLYRGNALSKEILRKFYRQTVWYEEVRKAKMGNRKDWKNNVHRQPPHIPAPLKNTVSDIYQSVANLLSEKKFFDAPGLDELTERLRSYL